MGSPINAKKARGLMHVVPCARLFVWVWVTAAGVCRLLPIEQESHGASLVAVSPRSLALALSLRRRRGETPGV